jgi:hypothetical protein
MQAILGAASRAGANALECAVLQREWALIIIVACDDQTRHGGRLHAELYEAFPPWVRFRVEHDHIALADRHWAW